MSGNTNFKIYWEKQDSAFCGVHCLNNLLQASYFTEIDLSEIALALDNEEKKLMMEMGVDTPDFLKYMAGDSERVDASGNFSVEVLRKAVEVLGLRINSISSESARAAAADPLSQNGFVCNLRSHWFAIRKLNGHWFNLNSLLKTGPTLITDFYLSAYLQQLQMDQYSIFVVEGDFPAVIPGAVLEGRGEWFDAKKIVADKGRSATYVDNEEPQIPPELQKEMDEARQNQQMDEDAELQRVLEMSRDYEQKQAAEKVEQEAKRVQEEQKAKEAHKAREQEEMQQRQAMLSPEPPADAEGTVEVQINCPRGVKAKRRFWSCDTLSDIFSFARATDVSLGDKPFTVQTSFPPVTFAASDGTLADNGLNGRVNLFVKL